jgi:hypothetical protein
MTVIPRRQLRWSNAGFALLSIGLMMLGVGRIQALQANVFARGIVGAALFIVALVMFLYPLADARLEQRRVLTGVIVGIVYLVVVWANVLSSI